MEGTIQKWEGLFFSTALQEKNARELFQKGDLNPESDAMLAEVAERP